LLDFSEGHTSVLGSLFLVLGSWFFVFRSSFFVLRSRSRYWFAVLTPRTKNHEREPGTNEEQITKNQERTPRLPVV
jgi:hypothetical protein